MCGAGHSFSFLHGLGDISTRMTGLVFSCNVNLLEGEGGGGIVRECFCCVFSLGWQTRTSARKGACKWAGKGGNASGQIRYEIRIPTLVKPLTALTLPSSPTRPTFASAPGTYPYPDPFIPSLKAGGGADSLLVADSLYAFAQSAEFREASLRSRAAAAEYAVCRERAAVRRREAALEEAEGLVAQVRMVMAGWLLLCWFMCRFDFSIDSPVFWGMWTFGGGASVIKL